MEALQYFFSDEVYEKWKDNFNIPNLNIANSSRVTFIQVIIPGINKNSCIKMY